MKTIKLSRVSTPEQKKSNLSLPAQGHRIDKYAITHNLEDWKEFEIDETAWKTNRAKFGQVIELLQKSKEPIALVCDKIDRLIRNFTKDLAILEELRLAGKLELHFPSDNIILHKNSPAADLFRWSIGIALAKYYSDAISDNVKRAIEQKLRNGEWPGKAPLGYKNIDIDDDKKWINPDHERADIVIKLFEWYSTGTYSMELLRRKSVEEGLTNNSKEGKFLTKSEVDHILKNPFYYGEMRYRDKIYPHRYKPLISRELFNKVQEVKQNWHKKPFAYAGKLFVYRGLLTCAHCGLRITFETAKGKYVYGHCTNFYKNCPNTTWVKEEEINEQVKQLLRDLSISQEVLDELVKELRDNHEAKVEYHERTMTNLKEDYDRLENRLDKMYEDWLDGRITKEKYDTLLEKYKRIQADTLLQMEQHSKADENYYVEASKLLELAHRAYELFEISEATQKRELLSFLLQNCKMDGKKLIPSLKMPFDAILVANKTQNWLPREDSDLQPFPYRNPLVTKRSGLSYHP